MSVKTTPADSSIIPSHPLISVRYGNMERGAHCKPDYGDLILGADGIKEEYLDTRASDIARGVRPQMRWIRERYNQPTTFV